MVIRPYARELTNSAKKLSKKLSKVTETVHWQTLNTDRLVKEDHTFYGSRTFNALFKQERWWTLPCAKSIKSQLSQTFFNIILPFTSRSSMRATGLFKPLFHGILWARLTLQLLVEAPGPSAWFGVVKSPQCHQQHETCVALPHTTTVIWWTPGSRQRRSGGVQRPAHSCRGTDVSPIESRSLRTWFKRVTRAVTSPRQNCIVLTFTLLTLLITRFISVRNTRGT